MVDLFLEPSRSVYIYVCIQFWCNLLTNSSQKEEVIAWLNQAKHKAAVQFGENTWANMHSGGTSVSPHCRPKGMRKVTEESGGKGKNKTKIKINTYKAKLDCPDGAPFISPFIVCEGVDCPYPDVPKVYNKFLDMVNAMS
jgi:hypothetical protein